ncbi:MULTISPECIES: copper resistance system multicopper oxidase [Variovorax]|jgi:CopA family copper-resistance protein|nr:MULTISPECIES: copper resistance system multicopper oxidase [Variovorax]MBN8756268.1 copper resistance system multicopper oxidase [Variovorax sp.]ODU14533.1 MAG: copper resistance protein CopA [Variovorax sp. SCN 67-85]ODV26486.1 MAG: copper resistance protein CopA [Variovorax sp. SCN 67-20]OJZ02451.1 MAG: copper resistance protein CopA [Variovorax sp. 67-131]UKI10421.1 copper resistance system multicopper oxidase [Variovorax paradoxus]
MKPRQSGVDRRKFLMDLGSRSVIGGLALPPSLTWAAAAAPIERTELHGTEFDLEIAETPVNLTGQARMATTVNGQIPAPTLRWREGDTVTLRVTNRLPVASSIHWHGILVPAEMDGVPGLSFNGIAPGETFVYRFPVKQTGTYWYHSHSRFQEQTGLYGPIVIDARDGTRFRTDREHVVLLSDWTDGVPEELFRKLKVMSGFFNFNQPTLGDFKRDIAEMGLQGALEKRKMWNRMRMVPTDLGDLTGTTELRSAARYLLNGKTADHNWTGIVKSREKVRLRFINGSATTIFDVRIPGLKMSVVAADGQDVHPVTVDEFRISVAETYDVIVEPSDDKAYTLFAQSIDRTNFVRGTLAPRVGMQAPVPEVDKPSWLTMTDMMGAMGSVGAMDSAQGPGGMAGMQEMGDMQGMDHSSMAGMNMGGDAKPAMKPPRVRHARTEYGPGVDMHVDMPRTNLDDPGINLRNNGRRVLTYADLRTIGGPIDSREPGRDVELHLTGNMERFMWSFDGQKFSESKPVHFRFGERLRLVLVNDTMMNHPIHLHGMWGELESPTGEFLARKHTINVQPAQRVTYRVTADAMGRWAYHCHLLYHMEAGMFREVHVS